PKIHDRPSIQSSCRVFPSRVPSASTLCASRRSEMSHDSPIRAFVAQFFVNFYSSPRPPQLRSMKIGRKVRGVVMSCRDIAAANVQRPTSNVQRSVEKLDIAYSFSAIGRSLFDVGCSAFTFSNHLSPVLGPRMKSFLKYWLPLLVW